MTERGDTNSILEAIAGVSAEVRELREVMEDHELAIGALRRRVDGSRPPTGPEPAIAVMARQGSAASFDVEELRGELIAVHSEQKAQRAASDAFAAAVRTELKAQSSMMGIGKRGLAWLRSPEGRRTIISLATLGGAGYAAWKAGTGNP